MVLLPIYNYILLKRDNSDVLGEPHLSTWVNKTKEQPPVRKTSFHFNFYKSHISSDNKTFSLKL